MSEQASLTERIIRPGVEEIHASIPHKGVRDLINDAKNIQRHMNRELEDIETDEDLNPEADAADTLKSLALDEFVEDWTLNLEKDVG